MGAAKQSVCELRTTSSGVVAERDTRVTLSHDRRTFRGAESGHREATEHFGKKEVKTGDSFSSKLLEARSGDEGQVPNCGLRLS